MTGKAMNESELVEKVAQRIYVHRHGAQWLRMFDLTGEGIQELTQVQVGNARSHIYNSGFPHTVVEYETDNPMMYEIRVGECLDKWNLDHLAEQLASEAEYIYESAKEIIALIKAHFKEEAVEALEEIREIYAGMEGFNPETAPEGYQQRIIRQMYEVSVKAITAIRFML